MPIDDLRTRAPATRPAADEADQDLDDEPALTAEEREQIDAEWIAELRRRVKDLDEGREQSIPLEEAMAYIFAEPTPEELAEMPPRRARR